MKLFIVVALLAGVCSAGRLEKTYLPPSSAQTAGGNDHSLDAPYGDSSSVSAARGSSRQYLPPSASGYSNGPATPEPILKYINEPNAGDGTYNFEYETANGIMHKEEGHLETEEEEVVEGSYSYTGPDGVVYTVNYRADAEGFHATGDHLPTAPPVPEAIQKSLELNAAAEAREAQQGYQYGASQGQGYQSGPTQNQGYQSGPAQSQGYQSGPAQSQGYQSGPAQSQGYQSDAAQSAGYQSGPAQSQGYQSGPAQSQGYQSGPAQSQGYQAGSAQTHGYQSGPAQRQRAQSRPAQSQAYRSRSSTRSGNGNSGYKY